MENHVSKIIKHFKVVNFSNLYVYDCGKWAKYIRHEVCKYTTCKWKYVHIMEAFPSTRLESYKDVWNFLDMSTLFGMIIKGLLKCDLCITQYISQNHQHNHIIKPLTIYISII